MKAFNGGENEVDSNTQYVHLTNISNQLHQAYNPMGNHHQYNSDMQHKGDIGKGKAGEAVLSLKLQQTTAVSQPREFIDVESSSHFSFGVEPIDNTILKENQSKVGI